MNRAITDKPMVMGVSRCTRFVQTVSTSATLAGGNFFSVNRLAEWIEQDDDRNRLCVVIDYSSPDVFEAENVIVRLRETLALLVVVDEGDTDAEFHAACMGAMKLIHRPVNAQELQDDFRKLFAVFRSDSFDVVSTKSRLIQQYDRLTQREKSILRLLMRGESNKRIASHLDISLRTVESDRANLMRNFKVDSFAELVQKATIAIEQMRLMRAKVLD